MVRLYQARPFFLAISRHYKGETPSIPPLKGASSYLVAFGPTTPKK